MRTPHYGTKDPRSASSEPGVVAVRAVAFDGSLASAASSAANSWHTHEAQPCYIVETIDSS
jgi:hypothetical protein